MIEVDETTDALAVFFPSGERRITCRLLRDILGDRSPAGFESVADGVWVSWELLAASGLSDGEKAAVHVAKGVAALERVGGVSGDLAAAVHDAVALLAPYAEVVR